jgi:hypothetical protein
MTTITIEVPDDVFSALRRAPDEFARDVLQAAAIQWYSQGLISQGKAAQIAGLSRGSGDAIPYSVRSGDAIPYSVCGLPDKRSAPGRGLLPFPAPHCSSPHGRPVSMLTHTRSNFLSLDASRPVRRPFHRLRLERNTIG